MVTVASILFRLLCDASTYVRLLLQPNDTVAAENLFLRKQLALYQERNIPRKPTDPATRFTMAWLAKLCSANIEVASTRGQFIVVMQPAEY